MSPERSVTYVSERTPCRNAVAFAFTEALNLDKLFSNLPQACFWIASVPGRPPTTYHVVAHRVLMLAHHDALTERRSWTFASITYVPFSRSPHGRIWAVPPLDDRCE
jgi:hypothetical protein